MVINILDLDEKNYIEISEYKEQQYTLIYNIMFIIFVFISYAILFYLIIKSPVMKIATKKILNV